MNFDYLLNGRFFDHLVRNLVSIAMNYRQNRQPTNFKVAAIHGDSKFDCMIVDISDAGARLHGVQGVNVTDEITIASSFGTVLGQVKWVKDNLCGVEFKTKISSQLVDLFQFRGNRAECFMTSSQTPRPY